VTALQAVLFDLDGTIIDSEPYWFEAEYKLVAEFGGQWSDDHAHALLGSDLIAAARYIRRVGGVDLEPPDIVARLTAMVMAASRSRMPWQPGARELLGACRTAAVPCALVTMSWSDMADLVVEQLPPDTFEAVVTGDQVRHGKPHPDPYLTACRLLDVEPARSVAIEDSPTGMASAEAAGCQVLVVPNRVAIAPAPTRTIVDSLSEMTLASLAALVPG
jgi:HAD superfamily hydrolase (TIGR01509 family)